MLLDNDPFRDFDFLFSRLGQPASLASMAMPLDAYRRGEDVWVHIDMPGISAENIDINVERGVLTVSAERNWQRQDSDQAYLTERSRGKFRRQVHLGESLDTEHIEADLHDGVLTLRIPVAAAAKPRKIAIGTSTTVPSAIEATATSSS